jgi:hypothetical protein
VDQGADGATPLPPGFEAAPRPGWRLRGASVPQPPKFDRARIEAQRGGGFIAGRLHDQREPPKPR